MNLQSYREVVARWVRREGLLGWVYAINQLWMAVLRRMTPLQKDCVNIFEREWDVCIILDACRADAMLEVEPECEFLSDGDEIWSVGSTSSEWMRSTFTTQFHDAIGETAYVTANPHSALLDWDRFAHVEPVYEYGWDNGLDTVPAEQVTDAAIEVARQDIADRLVVHYMQPHFPSVPRPIGHGEGFENVWKGLMIGRRSRDVVWDSYLENLRYVLDAVHLLLENVSGAVVITADHGNAMGEWWVYEHPVGIPLRSVRSVPWYRTTADDQRGYHPEMSLYTGGSIPEETVDEQLSRLGCLP